MIVGNLLKLVSIKGKKEKKRENLTNHMG